MGGGRQTEGRGTFQVCFALFTLPYFALTRMGTLTCGFWLFLSRWKVEMCTPEYECSAPEPTCQDSGPWSHSDVYVTGTLDPSQLLLLNRVLHHAS